MFDYLNGWEVLYKCEIRGSSRIIETRKYTFDSNNDSAFYVLDGSISIHFFSYINQRSWNIEDRLWVMLKNIFIVTFAFGLSSRIIYGEFTVRPHVKCDHSIPARIITNYLKKYFIDKSLFVVISTAATSEDQREVQQDSITCLTQSVTALEFSFQIMTKPTEEEFKFRSSFSLILIDDSIAFR